jgi:hypothetical protein
VNSFTLHIWDDERKRCTFYTVTKDGASVSEMEKFLSKYENAPKYEQVLPSLLVFILKSIGDDHGATEDLFNRFENQVIGLPVKGKVYENGELFHFPQFPLRLYALRLCNELVILFNGGVKDDETNQKSDVHMSWVEACQFADRINAGIKEGEIIVNEMIRKIYDEDGNDLIYLV